MIWKWFNCLMKNVLLIQWCIFFFFFWDICNVYDMFENTKCTHQQIISVISFESCLMFLWKHNNNKTLEQRICKFRILKLKKFFLDSFMILKLLNVCLIFNCTLNVNSFIHQINMEIAISQCSSYFTVILCVLS